MHVVIIHVLLILFDNNLGLMFFFCFFFLSLVWLQSFLSFFPYFLFIYFNLILFDHLSSFFSSFFFDTIRIQSYYRLLVRVFLKTLKSLKNINSTINGLQFIISMIHDNKDQRNNYSTDYSTVTHYTLGIIIIIEMDIGLIMGWNRA